MYLVDTEITVTWIIPPTDTPLVQGDYDISIVPSTLGGTYTDGGITTYVAPTEESSGYITYLFTPLAGGKYTLNLTTGTGASQVVLDEKIYWIFLSASVSVGSTKVISALSYAKSPPTIPDASLSYGFSDIDWYSMDAVSTDPSTGNILVVGRREFADSNGTFMIYDKSDDTFTNYTTIPFTDPSSVAMTGTGRVYVLEASGNVGSIYDCYYSDAPYTTWTLTTHTSTASHGNRIVVWDEVGEKMFWGTGAAFLTADENGTDFPSRQQYTSNGGPSVFNIGLVSFWRRFTLGGQSQWICGSTALTGQSERVYRSLATSAATTPIDAGEIDNVDDLFIGINGGPVIDMFKSPTEDKIFAFGQNGGIAASTNGTTWTDQVDTALVTDILTHYHGYTIPAFNKMYISGRDSLAATAIWESTDGATWTKSTDTRITAYSWKTSGNRVPAHWTHLDNNGVSFVHVVGTNQDRLIYMK